MDLGLKGKSALVLAAGGGLGERIAATLAREGANVCLTDFDQAALDAAVAGITKSGYEARGFQADLFDLAAVEEMTLQVRSHVGAIDILVNITGGPPALPTANVTAEQWEKYFRGMVLSVTTLTGNLLPDMRQRNWGRIITSTSSGVIAPIPDLGLSNALRSSLLGWSKTLSSEVAQDGVTVNVVVPGRIATKRIRELDELRAARENRPLDAIIAASTSTIPMKRYGAPQEYADTVAFLASERSSYMTGSIIRVDGGLISSI